MDPAFNQRLISCRVMLVKCLDVDAVLPYLVQNYIITDSMEEAIKVEKIKSDKASKLLSILSRRPNVKTPFLAALRSTNQSFIADALEGIESQPVGQRGAEQALKSNVFSDIFESIVSLKPGEQTTSRHGTVLLTSTQTYTKKAPVSKLGERELPFLFAVKAYGYSQDAVLGWAGAPSKAELTRALEIYEAEIAEVKTLVQNLESGGFHLIVKLRDERLLKLLTSKGNSQQFLIHPGGLVYIFSANFSMRYLSVADVDFLCCLVHLMCFSEHKFIFRKSCPHKPNCYLLFRASGMAESVAVDFNDRNVVGEAIGLDESVFAPVISTVACPW